jgi:hypothetical protein
MSHAAHGGGTRPRADLNCQRLLSTALAHFPAPAPATFVGTRPRADLNCQRLLSTALAHFPAPAPATFVGTRTRADLNCQRLLSTASADDHVPNVTLSISILHLRFYFHVTCSISSNL